MRAARMLAGAVAASVLAVPLASGAAAAPVPRGTARVVVQGRTDEAAAADAVRRAGGTVTTALPLVRGVAATVPAANVTALAADPAVRAVTPDAQVTFASTLAGGETTEDVK